MGRVKLCATPEHFCACTCANAFSVMREPEYRFLFISFEPVWSAKIEVKWKARVFNESDVTMAVSHQWFIQWSEPPMLFADITNKHNSINNWDKFERIPGESAPIRNGADYAILNNKRQRLKSNSLIDSSEQFNYGKFNLVITSII